MMARPPIRTEEGMYGALLRRIGLLERRVTKTPAGLPARLGPEGQEVLDWNDALLPGYYWAENTALNAPLADRFVGQVFVVGGGVLAGRIVQEVRIPTNGTQGRVTWRRVYDGTWQPWYVLDTQMQGTAAQRALTPAKYWDKWIDTDGAQHEYVGNKSGGWRQFSGTDSVAASAWALNSSSGSVITVGRTVSLTLPTVLETNETILLTDTNVGTGFGFTGMVSLIRNPTNTAITARHMQLGSTTTQALSIAWQIVQS